MVHGDGSNKRMDMSRLARCSSSCWAAAGGSVLSFALPIGCCGGCCSRRDGECQFTHGNRRFSLSTISKMKTPWTASGKEVSEPPDVCDCTLPCTHFTLIDTQSRSHMKTMYSVVSSNRNRRCRYKPPLKKEYFSIGNIGWFKILYRRPSAVLKSRRSVRTAGPMLYVHVVCHCGPICRSMDARPVPTDTYWRGSSQTTTTTRMDP
jgi:hypothetical protein